VYAAADRWSTRHESAPGDLARARIRGACDLRHSAERAMSLDRRVSASEAGAAPTVSGFPALLGGVTGVDRSKDADTVRALQEANERLERVNRELALEEERLRLALENSNIGVWDYDFKTGEMHVSSVWKRQLGYAEDEVTDRFEEWDERLHPEDRARVQATVQAYMKEPWPNYETEFRLRRRDGSYCWILSRASLLLDEAGRPARMLGSHLDITERKGAEERRAQLEAQLLQRQKIEALGTLAGGIAHDFNNLLGAILGNAHLARMDLTPDHPAQVSMEEILKAGHRARELVRRILTFSRPDEQQFRAVRLEPLVEEAATLLRSTLPAGVELHVRCEPDLPPVSANAGQVHQCIMNLATNAWHALPQRRGRIDLALAHTQVDANMLSSHPELRAEPYQCVSVTDNGVGMDASVAARVFEPFLTTKPPGEGTGLGLAIVHSVMRNHGGAVVAHSVQGEGSTFALYFPESAAADLRAPEDARSAAPSAGHGECILLIDDDEAMLSMARRYLQRCGYRVRGCTRVDAALAEFAADPRAFDLVVTDLNMPGMSGVEVAARLLDLRPDANVVLTSGYVSEEDAARAREIGIHEIVHKPNTVEQLAPLIRELLARANARHPTAGSPVSYAPRGRPPKR
jgi:PAS domain S-box-containing protein